MRDAAASNNLLLSVGHFMTGWVKNALQFLNEEHWLGYIRHEIKMNHCNGNRFDAQSLVGQPTGSKL
jgi:hypothetical protein